MSLILDRFVSASSAEDARESLKLIVKALEQPSSNDDSLKASSVWQEAEVLEALLMVLTTGEYKNFPVDEGAPLVCQVYQQLLEQDRESHALLKLPEEGRFMTSLLDVISSPTEGNYTRVCALQVFHKACSKFPSRAQDQLLQVPNGLNRLADLFQEENDALRSEILVVAAVVAQWPSCAKNWVMANDVADRVAELAIKEGGLTGGSMPVRDCLDLLYQLLKHDGILSELVWQSVVFAPKLSGLLDLRRGTEFMNPKQPSESDDLDDLLADDSKKKVVVPRLTEDEEELLKKVMHLLGVMMGSDSLQKVVWERHIPLCALMWELALFSPPPPDAPPVCALPSTQLQQAALECVAEFFASPTIMEHHNGLDRLLFLVCTGGNAQHLGLSQAALHVIRSTLQDDAAQTTVMHTLAPPVDADKEPEPTVIHKLLNTVLENLNADHSPKRKIMLLGGLGGLGLFLRDSSCRELMLKITNLVDPILQSLAKQDEDPDIVLALLKILCEWTIETPAVVKAILGSTKSTSLSILFGKQGSVSTMAGLLLGLCMEYMEVSTSEDEDAHGGWSRGSILTMLSNRGVSTVMTELEALKTAKDIPFQASKSEYKFFLDWYKNLVLIVRRRIIQELTGGAVGDEGEEDEDPMLQPTKGLTRLVAQQSEELQKLSKDLEQAQETIRSQASQLETWKRRIESNPTQLDEMLSEFSKKTADLESHIVSVENALEKEKEQKEPLREKVSQLEETVSQVSEEKDSAQREVLKLKDEMVGLSAAYASLEEEYNKASMARADETQPGGPIQQVVSVDQNDLDALRAQNAQLREDAKAADDWMRMAVQRMNDIGAENKRLQDQLGEMAAGSTLNTELEAERAKSQHLESELADMAANQETMKEEIRKQVEAELQSEDVSGPSSNNNEELEELRGDLLIAKAEVTALNEERRQLEMKLADVSAQKTAPDQGELASLQAQHNQELDSLRDSLQEERTRLEQQLGDELKQKDEQIQQLTVQLQSQGGVADSAKDDEIAKLKAANDAAQDWMQKAVEHHNTLSQQMQSLARENEDLKAQVQQLESGANPETVNFQAEIQSLQSSLQSRDAELLDLQSKMQSAVQSAGERTKFLEAELHSLQTAKSDLHSAQALLQSRDEEVLELQAKLQASLQSAEQGADERTKALEAELQDLHAAKDELESTKALLLLKEEENLGLQSKLESALQSRDTERQRLQSQMQNATQSSDERVKALLDELQGLQMTKDELQSAQALLLSKDEEVLKLQAKLKKMTLTQNADDRDRVGKLIGELEQSRLKSSEMEKELSSMFRDHAEVSKQIESLQQELAERDIQIVSQSDEIGQLNRSIEKLTNELADLAHLQAQVDILSAEKATVEKVCEDSLSTNAELKTKLEEFQSWSQAAQERLGALVAEKEAAEQLADGYRSSLEGKDYELDALKAAEAATKEDMGAAKEENAKLSSRNAEMEAMINNLNDKNTALEQDVDSLKEQAATTQDSLADLQNTLREKEDALALAEEELASVRTEVEETQAESLDVVTQWQERTIELEKEITESQQKLQSQQTQLDDTTQRCTELEKEKLSLQEELAKLSSESAELSSEKVKQLEDAVAELQGDLETQATEATDAVEQWSARCDELETELGEVKSSLDMVNTEKELQDAELESVETEFKELKAAHSSLQDRLKSAEEQTSKGLESLEASRAEWQVEKEKLEEQLELARSELSDKVEELSKLDNRLKEVELELIQVEESKFSKVSETDEKIKELQETVAELEGQLEQTQAEAAAAVDQWQDHAAMLEEEKTKLAEELQSATQEAEGLREATGSEKAQVEGEMEEERRGRAEAEATANELKQQMEELETESQNIIAQWEERVNELESTVGGLEEQLEQQQSEASTAIGQWEESCAALESQIEQFASNEQAKLAELDQANLEIENLKAANEEIKSTTVSKEEADRMVEEAKWSVEQEHEIVTKLQSELDREKESVSTLSARVEELSGSLKTAQEATEDSRAIALALESKNKEVEEELSVVQLQLSEVKALRTEEKVKADSVVHELTNEITASKEEISQLVEQRDAKNSEVLRLEDELRVANDSIQLYITDEISSRATEMATQALRDEMDEMRTRIVEERDLIASERNARMVAEQEAESLRADLMTVLRGEREDGLSEEKVRSLVMKTADGVQRKERQEIEQLRNSLQRAMEELEIARADERNALERATTAEIQVSTCEQEIVAAKSDVKFLTQNLEDTRGAEEARIASYEYRISSLEDDRAVLRRTHADEVETLRNELQHMAMEKDRILSSLKESEKANAALVYDSSKQHEDLGLSSQEREISKLRAANSRLLSAASEEAARTERRVRELVAANASTYETDILTERNLRITTEAALENVKEQLEEAQKNAVVGVTSPLKSTPAPPDKVSIQLKHSRAKSQKLEEELAALKAELEKQRTELQTTIDALTMECRRSQAIAMKIERENHFDSEVNAEISKIRNGYDSQEKSDNWVVVRGADPAAENPIEGSNSAFQAYDFILEQKLAMQEEREMYQELLDEHDFLLAVLEQLEYEKSCLIDGFRDAAGEEAVASVINMAKEQIIENHDTYIELR